MNVTKKTIALLLVFLLFFTALPFAGTVTAFAANNTQLNIQWQYNREEMTLDVSWNAVSNATGYYISFYNDDPQGNWYGRGSIPMLSPDQTGYHFGRTWMSSHGAGGMDYKIKVTAVPSSGPNIVEEIIFETGVSILQDVDAKMLSNGVFVWNPVLRAKNYTFTLYHSSGESLSHLSGAFNDCMYDFSDAMQAGSSYYAKIDASANGYRDSDVTQTDVVAYNNNLVNVTGLHWSGKTLRWNAVPGAANYYVMLEQYSSTGGTFFQRCDFRRTARTLYDFRALLSDLPKDVYRVKIFATKSDGSAASKVSYSPMMDVRSLSGTKISAANAVITAPVTGAAPDMTADPGESTYNVTVSNWYLDESPFPSLSASDTFASGKEYGVRIGFEANDGYYFDDDTVYSINGAKANYVGSNVYERVFAVGAADTMTLQGSVTSFLDASDEVTVKLVQPFSGKTYQTTFTGNNAKFAIPNVKKDTYSYTIKKKNHTTKTGFVTIGSLAVLVTQINPIGDINGDGNCTTVDYGMANSHVRDKKRITDAYKIKCGDVVGADNEITNPDAGRINSHARGKRSLWQ